MAAGDGGSWKNSPLVGMVLGIVIVVALISLIGSTFSDGSDSLVPSNFPNTYLAEADDGNYGAVLIVRGREARAVPFTEGGKEYWEAYICRAEVCPGRKDGKDYIFAAKRVPLENPTPPPGDLPEGYTPQIEYQQIECPLCKEARATAKKSERENFQFNADRYQTEEGLKIIDEIREAYRKQSGS
jgi:hypothetical protein